jgi:hypothetical protein
MRDSIANFLKCLMVPHEHHELLIRGRSVQTLGRGWSDDPQRLAARAACHLDDDDMLATYVSLNPIDLASLANHIPDLEPGRFGPGAGRSRDIDVKRRRRFLIDVDPKRTEPFTSDYPASDDEVTRAQTVVDAIRDYLAERGFPEPISTFSGNGYGLIYGCDLDPGDDRIERLLNGLSARFSNEQAHVDTSVHNPARLTRCVGTYNHKGDDVPDEGRPYRLSRLIFAPAVLEDVSPEVLDRVIDDLPAPERLSNPSAASELHLDYFDRVIPPAGDFDARQWLTRHGIGVKSERQAAWHGRDGTELHLNQCPFKGGHATATHGDPTVFIADKGPICFKCQHDGCADKGWRELRSLYEGRYWRQYDDPARVAELWVKQYRDDRHPKILLWQSSLHTWQDGVWREEAEQKQWLYREVTAFAERYFDYQYIRHKRGKTVGSGDNKKVVGPRLVTRSLVGDITNSVLSMIPSYGKQLQPGDRLDGRSAGNLMHLASSILDLDHFLATNQIRLIEPDPIYFNTTRLNYDITPETGEPTEFLAAVNRMFPDDGRRELLQEQLGYLLSPIQWLHFIILWHGVTESGKSLLTYLMLELVGRENYAALNFDNFAGRDNALAKAIGALLIAFIEARLPRKSTAATERLKAMASREPQDVDRKYLPSVDYSNWGALLITTNHDIVVDDASGAFFRRLVPLTFTRRFPEGDPARDPMLTKRLVHDELPQIALWALRGWKRLMQNGYFSLPEVSRNVIRRLREMSSPLSIFVEDLCDRGENYICDKDEFVNAYVAFCQRSGYELPDLGVHSDLLRLKNHITRELGRIIPDLRADYRPRVNGQRLPPAYKGVGLKDDYESLLAELGSEQDTYFQAARLDNHSPS